MTVQEFRGNPELVKWARELMETQNFLILLEALDSINPVKQPASPGVTPHGAHILLGEQTGWAQYRETMLSLRTRQEPPQQIPEPDYPNPEETEET